MGLGMTKTSLMVAQCVDFGPLNPNQRANLNHLIANQ